MREIPLVKSDKLVDAIQAIEKSQRRIAVVVSDEGRLLGTLTDGDVRRCLLNGGDLKTPVMEAMNCEPVVANEKTTKNELAMLMRESNILAVPIVDEKKVFLRLLHITDLSSDVYSNRTTAISFAVIMAGGEGTRLRPITNTIPKPMVDICGVPLLERQIKRLKSVGVQTVYLSVNYLSHVIENHFGDGDQFGIEIKYLREKVKLGTGGALSLITEKPEKPIIVMNGDILTSSDLTSIVDFHVESEAVVTMAAIDYQVNIPFGVVQNEGQYVKSLVEKPSQRFLCNAGMYVLAPSVFESFPSQVGFNMTDVVEQCLSQNQKVAVFPMHEYWSDIGTPADLEKARTKFSENV